MTNLLIQLVPLRPLRKLNLPLKGQPKNAKIVFVIHGSLSMASVFNLINCFKRLRKVASKEPFIKVC